MGSAHDRGGGQGRRARPRAAARTSRSSTSAAPPSRACPARASSTCRSRPRRRTSRASSRCSTTSASARSPGPDPWPPTRPMPVGSLELDGKQYRIHLHVQPRGGDFPRDIAFRDALRNDPELRSQYEGLKRGITERRRGRGPALHALEDALDPRASTAGSGFAPPPIAPAGDDRDPRRRAARPDARPRGARARLPDRRPGSGPACTRRRRSPTRSRSRTYDDVAAALRLAARVLGDHVRARARRPCRRRGARRPAPPDPPGSVPAQADSRTASPSAGSSRRTRAASRRGARSRAPPRSCAAAAELGYPLRLKAARGGYDGRSQVRLDGAGGARRGAGRPVGWPALLLERELAFEAELSVVVARNVTA